MGELAGNFQDSPEAKIQGDKDQAINQKDGGVDIEGLKDIKADAINKRDNLPVFKVSHNEFHQNMEFGRKRLRFKSGSGPQKFMQSSNYKQSFWIQHEKDGYMRKVK
jgi:hypothetical protein